MKLLREKYSGVKLIISVDRLDYIKGIDLRIEALEQFLTKNPDYVGKILLLQLIIPSREDVEGYKHLKNSIEQNISSLNGKFGSIDCNVVQSQYSAVSKDELTALYTVADVCIVSSTRDGMNVVSLEYVACQSENHGVLVVSEFAGVAEFLTEAACVKFNPWDCHQFSDAISEAVTMDEPKRKSMSERAYRYVATNTSPRWGQVFLDAFEDLSEHNDNTGQPAHDP